MAESVRTVGQIAMDMFYQEFKPAGAFLRLKHFVWLCIAADGKLKQDEYNNQVMLNLRARKPNAQVILSADNYDTVVVKISKSKAILPTPIMTFPGAGSTYGVSQVIPEGNCRSFMPLSEMERWQACNIKDVVFWFPIPCGIEFLNLAGNCDPKQVTVSYIPQVSENSTVQETRKWSILNMVTVFVKSAKDGVIIDMSNDGNPNVASQTEINKYLLKALQQQQ